MTDTAEPACPPHPARFASQSPSSERQGHEMSNASLLDVRDLTVRFDQSPRPAVDRLSFQVGNGEAVALVGESGCGKSTTAMSILGLLPRNSEVSGEIRFEGQALRRMSEAELDAIRGGGIGIVFQEPMAALNPVHSVGRQIAEMFERQGRSRPRSWRARVLELLELVRLPEPQRIIDSYPHELSGGQRQRVMIAMAIACSPRLLIADEPTTAIDASVRAQILGTIDDLRRQLSMGLLLIAHDLPMVARWADRVLVMHHGTAVEELRASTLLEAARHPYTRGLADASLRFGSSGHYTNRRLAEIRSRRRTDGHHDYHLIPARPVPDGLPARRPAAAAPLLQASGLVTEYGSGRQRYRALDDVSLTIAPGEVVGLVGESGSGKSTLARTIARLVEPASGRITFRGIDWLAQEGAKLRHMRKHMQVVFQDPFSALNPRSSVRDLLSAVLTAHERPSARERERRVLEVLDQVGLAARSADRRPHEFSGGQRQRICIARALILRPSLVICDEPVSALDVSVQAQILNLLVELRRDLDLAYLFISHDLAVVQYIADRILVMKSARTVEEIGRSGDWDPPRHPYTARLIAAAA